MSVKEITMKHEKLFLRMTLISLLTLVLYIICGPLLGAVHTENAKIFTWAVANLILSVFVMAVYVHLFLYIYYIRKGQIEDSLFHKEDYHGFKEDIVAFLTSEKSVFLTAAAINIGSWLLINGDRLIFGKRTFSAVLLVYAPMNMLGSSFPEYLSIVAYVLSSIMLYLFYVVDLALMRKRAYNNLYVKIK